MRSLGSILKLGHQCCHRRIVGSLAQQQQLSARIRISSGTLERLQQPQQRHKHQQRYYSGQEHQQQQQQQKRTMAAETVSSHYETHTKAETYDDAYFFEPGEYMEYLVNLIGDRLQLEPTNTASRSRCILDVGGGTGMFVRALLEENETANTKAVVVDPFLLPSDSTPPSSGSSVSFVKAPAEDFLFPPSSGEDCWRTNDIDKYFGGYDQILLKEVVHHFDQENRVGIFRGMKEGLRKGEAGDTKPSILIITRPQTDIDYPMWKEANDVWEANQPTIESFEDDLREAGFTNIMRTVESYPCSIRLERWQSMVRARFWSTFSHFSDEELEKACETIAQEAKKKPHAEDKDGHTILHFEDRLIFLSAS